MLASFTLPISRDAQLRRNVDPQRRGIEIGALNNPIIRPDEGPVEFVDYCPTAGLKEQHKGLPDRVAGIVEVNHVWTGTGSLAEAIGQRDVFQYALASHVIEHVPNVLGWFQGIHEVLAGGGVFNLAVPDRRYTFDVTRKESTLGELVEAHLYGFKIPSVRQMFDHCALAAAVEPGSIWHDDLDIATLAPFCGEHAVEFAFQQALQIVNENRYVDSHCWIFTPSSLMELLAGAMRLKLFPFVVDDITSTEPGTFEFYVHLSKPQGLSQQELEERQKAGMRVVREQLQRQQKIARIAAL